MSSTEASPSETQDVDDLTAPLYEKLKAYIRSRIESGELSVGHRVPSENELVDSLGVSRMTANRALRELAAEGLVDRVRGKGSFVAAKKRASQFETVPNIADEIRQRGSRHSATIVFIQGEACGPELADLLELPLGSLLFHTIIVHREDELPIQLEDRFVNPKRAPDYIHQDFMTTTSNAYLSEVAPIVKAEQYVEATNALPWECKLLAISKIDPCLLIRRRTWSAEGPVSTVRLLYPGSRYRLQSGFSK
ncbi:MAG: histidine utilization repressor [Methylorubrum populi]